MPQSKPEIVSKLSDQNLGRLRDRLGADRAEAARRYDRQAGVEKPAAK